MESTPIRTLACLLLALPLATGTCAAGVAGVARISARVDGNAAQARQFIDRSVVTYPTTLGDYVLLEAGYQPENFANGVSLGYALRGAPALKLTIFVYPRGRQQEAQTVDSVIEEVRLGVRNYEKDGTYAKVVMATATPFKVASPAFALLDQLRGDSQAVPVPAERPGPGAEVAAVSGAAQSPDGAQSELLLALRDSARPTTIVGKRMAIALDRAGKPTDSLAYGFYRDLYAIKVRASATSADFAPGQFSAMSDAAVAVLVPAIDIQNYGTCGEIVVPVEQGNSGRKRKADDNAMALAMVRGMGRVQAEKCATAQGKVEALPPQMAQQELVFPDGTWTSD